MDADISELMQLVEEVQEHDGYPPRRPRDLRRFVASPRALASFVAVDQGRVVGHVCVNPTSSAEALELAQRELDLPPSQLGVVARLVVSREHRRQGVARALLDAAAEEVARLGRTPILDVATHLQGAVSLYESIGWRKLGRVSVAFAGGEALEEYVFAGPA